MIKLFKVRLSLFIINNFLCGTRFFRLKSKLLKFAGITVGKNTKIVGPLDFNTVIKISIGNNCWIGKNLSLDGNGEVIIGNNVDIAPHVVINTGGHKIGDTNRRAGEGVSTKIVIEDGCWVGTRVTIIRDTRIGKGCMVAAGALVKGDMNENSLIAGIPAIEKKKYY